MHGFIGGAHGVEVRHRSRTGAGLGIRHYDKLHESLLSGWHGLVGIGCSGNGLDQFGGVVAVGGVEIIFYLGGVNRLVAGVGGHGVPGQCHLAVGGCAGESHIGGGLRYAGADKHACLGGVACALGVSGRGRVGVSAFGVDIVDKTERLARSRSLEGLHRRRGAVAVYVDRPERSCGVAVDCQRRRGEAYGGAERAHGGGFGPEVAYGGRHLAGVGSGDCHIVDGEVEAHCGRHGVEADGVASGLVDYDAALDFAPLAVAHHGRFEHHGGECRHIGAFAHSDLESLIVLVRSHDKELKFVCFAGLEHHRGYEQPVIGVGVEISVYAHVVLMADEAGEPCFLLLPGEEVVVEVEHGEEVGAAVEVGGVGRSHIAEEHAV